VKIPWTGPWVGRIDWCEGHWYNSTYIVVQKQPKNTKNAYFVVMSSSRAGSSHSSSWGIFSSARLVTFFTSARKRKLAKNEPKIGRKWAKIRFSVFIINLYWKWLNYAAKLHNSYNSTLKTLYLLKMIMKLIRIML
jgi:hypothetical protein